MGRRILLIDDEEVLAKNIKRYLEKRGFDTVIATTGSDGLQGFAKLVVDLVLLDINLPDVHGLTLVEQFRSDHPQIKIICFSGSGNDHVAADAIEAGADAFVTKPLRLRELLVSIEDALKRQHSALRCRGHDEQAPPA
jgi:two-component system response regulator HydG